MKLNLIDISWSASSLVSPNAKVASCLDLETRVGLYVIVYRQYLAILGDLIQSHYDGQFITGWVNSALPTGKEKMVQRNKGGSIPQNENLPYMYALSCILLQQSR